MLYRLWCRLRGHLVTAWLSDDRAVAHWDKAVKGSSSLHVALLRMAKSEVAKRLRLCQVSVLLDLSNFYDLVDHDLLAKGGAGAWFSTLSVVFVHIGAQRPAAPAS